MRDESGDHEPGQSPDLEETEFGFSPAVPDAMASVAPRRQKARRGIGRRLAGFAVVTAALAT